MPRQHLEELHGEGRRSLIATMTAAAQGRRSLFDEVVATIESVSERGGGDVRLVLK